MGLSKGLTTRFELGYDRTAALTSVATLEFGQLARSSYQVFDPSSIPTTDMQGPTSSNDNLDPSLLNDVSATEKLSPAELATTVTGQGNPGLPAPVTSVQAIVSDPPPDGGWLAWSQVLAGHLVEFNSWGFINSFGIFQAYLTTYLGRSPSDISWVGGMQMFLTFFVGTLSGRSLDAGYYKPVALIGLTLQVIGIMTTSAVNSYWQLFLAQGICQGLGNGLLFTPTMANVSSYFSTKRSRAIMGMSSGTATGGVIFPLIARQLLDKIGFGWTMRVMGFIVIVNGFISFTLVKTRLRPRKSGPIAELSSFKDPWYGCLALGLCLCTLGLYIGYFYVTVFAQDVLHASQDVSFDILMASNAIGLPSRFIQAYLADRWYGPLNGLLISSAMTGIVSLAWIRVTNIGGTYAFAIVYGFYGAAITTFFPPALANTGRDPRRAGMEIGMCFSLCGISCLVGPPIAGSIITASNGDYLGAQLFTGLSLLVGTILCAVSRFISSGPKLFATV